MNNPKMKIKQTLKAIVGNQFALHSQLKRLHFFIYMIFLMVLWDYFRQWVIYDRVALANRSLYELETNQVAIMHNLGMLEEIKVGDPSNTTTPPTEPASETPEPPTESK